MTGQRNTTLAWLVAIGVALALSGCATAKRDWQEANRQGTVEAYEEFLQNHPDTDQAGHARRLLAELRAEKEWGKTESMDTIDGYRDFLRKHPQSKQAKQALEHLEQLELKQDWEHTKSSGTIASYEEFIEKHPRSTQVSEARLELGRLKAERDWKTAKEANSLRGFESFLQNHPSSQYSNEARERLAPLREKQERRVLSRLQDAIANAKELPALPISRSDFAKNIVIKASHSILEYNGATVQALGTAFAKIPSKGDVWQPIDTADFVIIQIGKPSGLKNVIAHTAHAAISLGYVIGSMGKLTLIIPREIMPCELEFQGVLYGRIRFER